MYIYPRILKVVLYSIGGLQYCREPTPQMMYIYIASSLFPH